MPAIATGTGRALLNPTTSYLNKLRSLFGAGSIVALWPQNESAGSVSLDVSGHAYNGAYTGVTLGAAGIGDGNTAASFDGTTSFNNIYSAGLAGAFNPAEFTVITWVKVSGVGVWSDGVDRYLFGIRADANNRAFIYRVGGVAGRIDCQYVGGATTDIVSLTSLSSTNYLCIAMTLSVSGDALKAYLNGAQFGTTQTGIGTWVGALDSGFCCIGARQTTPQAVMSGSIGPVVLLNRAATASEILQAATV